MSNYQLVQVNVARMRGVNINDPFMKEFVDNLESINTLAESSKGFVWRLKDESNNATNFNPYNDERVIINISVWESIEALEDFVYDTLHRKFLKHRKEWFDTFAKIYMALWWIEKGKFPAIKEATDKLDNLQKNGASEFAFDFKRRFSAPDDNYLKTLSAINVN